jgi:hypothetical protein
MSRSLRLAIGGLLTAVAIGAGASPARAGFVNGSFETGDFTGWSTIGATSNVGTLGIVIPPDGTRQALLTNDAVVGAVDQASIEAFLGLAAGTLDTLGNGNAIEGSAIKQTIIVSAGTVMTFNWNFLTDEDTPSDFNDFAFVSIVADTIQTLANTGSGFVAATSTDFDEMTGYQTFTHTFASAGTYTIGVGVMDEGDTQVNSALLVDNFQAPDVNPIPAPPGAVLAAIGALGLVGGRAVRRRMTPAAA